MKKIITLLISVIMVMSLVACGGDGGEGKVDGVEKEEKSGPVYVVNTNELDPTVYPDDYPLIPISDFEAAFEKLKADNMSAEIESYQDVADIFKVDGAYYEKNDFESGEDLYKYYGWYADDGSNVLITFKADGDNLEYYAYTSNGVN